MRPLGQKHTDLSRCQKTGGRHKAWWEDDIEPSKGRYKQQVQKDIDEQYQEYLDEKRIEYENMMRDWLTVPSVKENNWKVNTKPSMDGATSLEVEV